MTTDSAGSPRRRLRPIHLVIVLALLAALGLYIGLGSNVARTLAGKGPPAQPNEAGTTQREAEAYSRGQGPEGSNTSQDSYTTQNRSRPPG
jgi:hypothetical protein